MCDFLNDLSTAVNKDILAELNFANNTAAKFNSWINGSNYKINFTVFHANIRSLKVVYKLPPGDSFSRYFCPVRLLLFPFCNYHFSEFVTYFYRYTIKKQ